MAHTLLYRRRKACIHRSKMNIMEKLKGGLDTRKYFLILSNLLDILEVTESIGFNIEDIVLDLDFATVSPEKWEIHRFYLPLLYCKSFNDGIVNYMYKISIYSKYSAQSI